MPLNYHPLYKKFKAKVPKATKTWKELASLPLFIDLSSKNLNFILKKVKKFDKNYNKF